MTTKFKTYTGLNGKPFMVLADTIETLPELHMEPERFPYATLAGRLGIARDSMASIARAPECQVWPDAVHNKRFRKFIEAGRKAIRKGTRVPEAV